MAIVEGLTLDGLVLNDATFGLEALDLTPPKQRADWVGSADSEYAALFRDPLYENRTIVAKLSIAPQATMDLALGFVGSVRDKLAEASKTQDGLDLVWAPSNGTKSVTFSVLSGEVSELPIDWENGWLVAAPSVTVSMTAKPFWRRSTETVLTAVASGTAPLTTVTVPSVGGDAPALGRLIVSNTGTGAIRWLEWGVEQRGYNAGSPASLVLDSDSLVTSGFAGTGTTRAGAYDPGAAGPSVIRVTVPTLPTAMCGTGTLAHVGRFKVSARVFAETTTTRMRLVWRAGDGSYTANPWVTSPLPSLTTGSRVDLGIVDIPVAVVGTQAWDGRLEVYDVTAGAAYVVDVDYLQLVPVAEGYGRSKAVASSAAGVVVAVDQFTGTTAAGALNARTPPLGAAWATSGATTDFAFMDPAAAVPASSLPLTEAVGRSSSSASLRFGVFGSAMTDQLVQAQVGAALANGVATGECGEIARWVDASNYLRFTMTFSGLSPFLGTLKVTKVVAGVATVLASQTVSSIGGYLCYLTLAVTANGNVTASLYSSTGALLETLTASDTVLATAGTLASGKAGIVDSGDGTNTVQRWYDEIIVTLPTPEPAVINPSRGYQARYDDTYRESTTAGTWGRETSYRGARFLIPPAGTDALTSRVAVHANTAELDTAAMTSVTGTYTVQVAYTERGLVVPR